MIAYWRRASARLATLAGVRVSEYYCQSESRTTTNPTAHSTSSLSLLPAQLHFLAAAPSQDIGEISPDFRWSFHRTNDDVKFQHCLIVYKAQASSLS